MNTSHFFGLVRASTTRQAKKGSLKRQREKLQNFGINNNQILEIIGSGKKKLTKETKKEPMNKKLKKYILSYETLVQRKLEFFTSQLLPGQVLVLSDSSRFSRDYFWAIDFVNKLYARGINLIVLSWGTNKPLSIPELHRFYNEIYEAQSFATKTEELARLGIEKRRRLGAYKGSKSKLSKERQVDFIKDVKNLQSGFLTLNDLSKKYTCSRTTIFRYRKKVANGDWHL